MLSYIYYIASSYMFLPMALKLIDFLIHVFKAKMAPRNSPDLAMLSSLFQKADTVPNSGE